MRQSDGADRQRTRGQVRGLVGCHPPREGLGHGSRWRIPCGGGLCLGFGVVPDVPDASRGAAAFVHARRSLLSGPTSCIRPLLITATTSLGASSLQSSSVIHCVPSASLVSSTARLAARSARAWY